MLTLSTNWYRYWNKYSPIKQRTCQITFWPWGHIVFPSIWSAGLGDTLFIPRNWRMKRLLFSPVTIFSSLLKIFCVCVVTYEVYRGTRKFLSNPVANVVYTVETELPMLTVCSAVKEIKFGPMPVSSDDLRWKGKFYPDDKGTFLKNCTHCNHHRLF